jgi:catechol 2,3-dioxygenase-like lactoylglutathione lyase family enzyme
MTRRQMLAVMGAAAAQRALGQSPLKFRGLDHIEFTVADVERSTNFYAQLFGGADVMKNRTTTRRYIKLGASYMAIDKADAPRIDHVCLGVENFNIDEVHAFLTAKGLTYRDYPSGRDTGVNDPDGTRLQLSSADGWTSLAAQTASPEPHELAVPQLFKPIEMTESLIDVSGLSLRRHYELLTGDSTRPLTFRVGRGRIQLRPGPVPGFQQFTVLVQPFDTAGAAHTLESLGARVLDSTATSVNFFAPVGSWVEVTSERPAE